jgi:ParB/RepB/Spo0J family partition protein
MLCNIAVTAIDPNPRQPRTYFAGLDELTASLQRQGLLEPIIVRPKADRYELICGERRWRAACMARWDTIPALVREVSDEDAVALSLLENLQRHNLTPLEEAQAYAQLRTQGWTQAAIGALIGHSQSYVAHKLRLLRVPSPLTFYLSQNALTENHLRQVLKLQDIYGADLPASFVTTGITEELILKIEQDIQGTCAGLLLCNIRPEDRPCALVYQAKPLIVEATTTLLRYVAQHAQSSRWVFPQWELAAFWWESLAVQYDLPVEALAQLLSAWEERYDHAVVWWATIGSQREPPTHEMESCLYWGWKSDLRHSGSLEVYRHLDPENTTRRDAYIRRVQRVCATAQWILPSSIQHGDADLRERMQEYCRGTAGAEV